MTLENQLKSADQLVRLWRGLLPNLEVPADGQFLRWVGMRDADIAAHAINRTAKKYHKTVLQGCPMTAEAASRYVTSIIHNEMTNTRDFRNRRSIAPQHA
jgi:hypothetical protein